MLKPGDKAPDFSLTDKQGKVFQLSQLIGKKSIVLYFYPKDNTRGCTAQACSFRDQYEVFQEHNAEVIGISADDAGSHENFSAKYKLPFILLSDTTGQVRKLYRVPKTLGLVPGRVTYLIDKKGVIRYAFNSQLKPLAHVTNTLEVLKGL